MALSMVILSILLAISLTVTALLLKDLKTSSASIASHEALYLAQTVMDCAIYYELNITNASGTGVFPTNGDGWDRNLYQYVAGEETILLDPNDPDTATKQTIYKPYFENNTEYKCLGVDMFPNYNVTLDSSYTSETFPYSILDPRDRVKIEKLLDPTDQEAPPEYFDDPANPSGPPKNGVKMTVTIYPENATDNCATLTQYAAPGEAKLFVARAQVPCKLDNPAGSGDEATVERVIVVKAS